MTKTPVSVQELSQQLSDWASQHSAQASEQDQQIRSAFVHQFPLETLPEMKLDEFVMGRGDQENFCYWLERKTDSLGSMFGGSARKFGVYWSAKNHDYVVNRMFGSAEEAKDRILRALKQAGELVREDKFAEADDVTASFGESRYTMRLKPQTLYYPDKLLPINNPYHLQAFLRLFGQEPSGGPLALNHQLLQFLKSVPGAEAYDSLSLMRFLYDVYPPKLPEQGSAAADQRVNEEAKYLLEVAEHTRNIILYGPPGTGKTHTARAFAQAWLAPEPEVKVDEQGTRVSTWWQAAALSLSHLGEATTDQIVAHPIMQEFARQRKNSHVYNTVWAELLVHTPPDDPSSNTTRRAKPYLFTHALAGNPSEKGSTRWTLTEDGRNYVSQLSAGVQRDVEPPQSLHFVTFHPAFTYEEFIQGLRPTASGGFEVRDGVFKRLCDTAHQNPDQDFVLIIDEINRADTAKTFGELITLIEDGKRASPGERGQYEVTLPYAPKDAEPFSVPDNVYVIGTMNTADRSITLMDVALRRRFTFIFVPPRPELLSGSVQGTNLSPARLLEVLNRKITAKLDADHQIGHAYLMGETLTASDLTFRWRHKIIPLLQEYFYAREKEFSELLGDTLYLDATLGKPLTQTELMSALMEFTERGSGTGMNAP